jgi:hypothetical protein
MKRQREHVEAELERLESKSKPRDVEGLVVAAASKVWQLADDLHRATPKRCREVFGQLVDRIDLTFGSNRRGKRVECPVISGVIHLSASRGDKTAIELFTASVAAWDSGLRRRFAGLAA